MAAGQSHPILVGDQLSGFLTEDVGQRVYEVARIAEGGDDAPARVSVG
ncbi:hypothetical protein J2S41_007015 [Catenuloplanes atrovinosus]|uniref:Uncharacterized protein n=1 Tax=Catenuloplanes atrovinosus TaxID=137266 RepID=A0AAE3YVY8_9ACTN|nr:hypothetical protein [Catenuloplanes atrovinosus]MDR7280237.1 hypothetical protein [Catenuloplanes atrovinosus]